MRIACASSSLTRGAAIASMAATTGCAALRALRHAGQSCLETSLPETPGDVRVRYGTFQSRYVASPVGYALVVPNGIARWPVSRLVYVVPGRDDTARDVVTSLGYAAAAQSLVQRGKPSFAVLAVDSGASYYHPRASGEDRLALLERELPALARRLLGSTFTSEALVGQSMGGYGALLAAERDPRRYRAVAVAAPAIFRTYSEEDHAVGDAFDSAEQFERYDVLAGASRLAFVPVLVRVGYDDPFLANVKAFAKACPHADVGYVEHGCHDAGFWRATATELLAFAIRDNVA